VSSRDTATRLAAYLSYLDGLVGSDHVLREIAPREPQEGRVLTIAYADAPEPGFVTGFTYGLSLAVHPDWPIEGREICITVRSSDLEWAAVPALSVAALRGFGPFNRGQVMGYKEPYVRDSRMNNILLGDPADAWRPGLIKLVKDGLASDESDRIDFILAQGSDKFWRLPWDRFDPRRPPAA
jgi:hypothetical protein